MDIESLYKIYLKHSSVQTDSRKIKAADLFFALKGPSFNGNAFARKAIEDGAAFAVIDEVQYAIDGKTVLVPDVLLALQELARYHRQQFSIPFIAITGSNGKTTTKELIHAVLTSTFTTYTTEGNLNNHIGVPLTILKIKSDAQIAVIEMGANHLQEIASYCEYAMPTHGLITNVGKAHLEGFGSEAGVRKGKGELFDYVREHNGTIFRMNDYEYLVEMSEGISSVFTYGSISNADVVGNIAATAPYLAVAFSKGFKGIINTNLVGSYNQPNVLAAVAVGKYFSVADEQIKEAIENYVPSNSRSQLIERGTSKIILDAYNANPSSMKAAIENFAAMDADNKILVLGAMAEMGVDSIKEHEAIVQEIAKHNWKEVILTGGDFLNINHTYKQFATPEEAGAWLNDKAANAYILIKGSRSMQMEKILNYLPE